MTVTTIHDTRTAIKHQLQQLHKQPIIPYEVLYELMADLGDVSYKIEQIEKYGFLKEVV